MTAPFSSKELKCLIDREPQFCILCCTIYDESIKVKDHVCEHCSQYCKEVAERSIVIRSLTSESSNQPSGE